VEAAQVELAAVAQAVQPPVAQVVAESPVLEPPPDLLRQEGRRLLVVPPKPLRQLVVPPKPLRLLAVPPKPLRLLAARLKPLRLLVARAKAPIRPAASINP
jgi:hypothetical protein